MELHYKKILGATKIFILKLIDPFVFLDLFCILFICIDLLYTLLSSGGWKNYRRGATFIWETPTPSAAIFRKIYMSKRKNRDS